MPKKSKKKKISRKKLLTIVIVGFVLLVALTVGAVVRFAQQRGTQNQNLTEEIFVPGQNFPKAVNESQSLALQGKGEEATKKIEEALSKNPEDTVKFELHIQQGINYQNQKDYAKALEQYRQAETIKQDDKVTLLIAEVALLLGDKPLAVDYYKKTVTLLPADSPLYEQEKSRIEAKIKAAGG